jgi:hypothetical protein
MNSLERRTLKVCAGCAALGAVVLFGKMMTASQDGLSKHLKRLALLRQGPLRPPQRASDLLRTLPWLLLGRPTFQEWGDSLEAEQRALISLGYYERRWVPWRDGDPQWESAFTNAVVWRTRYCLHGDSRRLGEIRVTARPDDLLEFENIVREQLGQLTNPLQPGSAANRRQPFRSEIDQTSGAAGSGR